MFHEIKIIRIFSQDQLKTFYIRNLEPICLVQHNYYMKISTFKRSCVLRTVFRTMLGQYFYTDYWDMAS